MSFFMRPKQKLLRKVAFVAAGLFIASVILGAGFGALDWLGGGEQDVDIDAYLEQMEAEINRLKEDVAENPEDGDTLSLLGQYQMEMGFILFQYKEDHDKAQEYFSDALDTLASATELNPEDPNLWMEKGRSALLVDEHDQAYESFQKATELDPDNLELWLDKASSLIYLEDLEGAKGALSRALELDPEHRDALDTYASILFEVEDYEGAIDKWEQIIELDAVREESKEFYQSMIEYAEDVKKGKEEPVDPDAIDPEDMEDLEEGLELELEEDE